jgi:hypothetical protein
VVLLALTLSGIGVGASLPRVSASVANSVEDVDLGVAGATQQLFAQIGTTVGINLLETIQVTAAGTMALARSYSVAYGVGAAVSVAGLFIAFGLREPRRDRSALSDRPVPGRDTAPVSGLDRGGDDVRTGRATR